MNIYPRFDMSYSYDRRVQAARKNFWTPEDAPYEPDPNYDEAAVEHDLEDRIAADIQKQFPKDFGAWVATFGVQGISAPKPNVRAKATCAPSDFDGDGFRIPTTVVIRLTFELPAVVLQAVGRTVRGKSLDMVIGASLRRFLYQDAAWPDPFLFMWKLGKPADGHVSYHEFMADKESDIKVKVTRTKCDVAISVTSEGFSAFSFDEPEPEYYDDDSWR